MNEEKKLLYRLSTDNMYGYLCTLEGALIEIEEDKGEQEYTLSPVWLTEEEIEALPEWDGS